MQATRRHMLKGAGRLGALSAAIAMGLLKPMQALAGGNPAGFSATSVDGVLSAIGASGALESADVHIVAPDIAEDAAAVSVEVAANMPDVEFIAILDEKSPHPLIEFYNLSGLEGFVATRIKIGPTANLRAVVKAGGKYFTATRKVRVGVSGYAS
jgi:sulfur-oxidizing protein SoxY